MFTEFRKTLQRLWYDRPLKPGHTLEHRYTILEVLGMGSYGITYLASDQKTNTKVVLKQLRTTKARTASGLRSFKRESIILETLQHPRVPRLLDVFENENNHFIVMEWIQGKTFEDLIFRKDHKYSEKDTIRILVELLTIVETFHEKGIIHRDLRIPNIIERNGKLHIIDFGLACFLTDQEDLEPNEHPEKLRMRAVAMKSDLFALGHFALFLLYSTYEPLSRKERGWQEELDISLSFKTILRKMLQLDEPFQSACEARIALEKI
ncbi:serine/threonine-protein kinase [Bacillus sp. NEB1478]|uniref:serine/threonine protein kinase n=1 Tax=Bacillus sp. NEB1478 TaxID=3073816 RepID=UPI002872EDEA|nr:serine/threonine-protein kinase [Bacillus sp. NEB1478]WNB92777.1 serine/threonine-protein kinase [Bacillus sp. NEB1478]